MMESGELPDWLAEIRDRQLSEQARQQPQWRPQRIVDDLQQPVSPQPAQESEAGPKDELEGLREQLIQASEEYYAQAEKGPFYKAILDLPPAQRFVLALMLFLNVAICGCLALLVTGRVALP
ncbi:MAG: hypothetical protein N2508_13545 [Anaerolineae bacterium]|nr:hypothetical protein [Anaerolineae bacterium]